MARTIVGTFASTAEAEQAAATLEAARIPRTQIRVLDAGAVHEHEEIARGEGRTGGGFWSWLFGDVDSESGRGVPDDEAADYSERMRSGGAMVMVTTSDDDADRVHRLLDRRGARDVQERGPAGTTDRATDVADTVMPVVEEDVRIGKRPVEQGGVRIYRHVSERPVEEHLRLLHERIRVERRPVDRPIGTLHDDPFKEQTIELRETAEEPVVEKRARVVEEVAIGKEVEARDTTVRETVRRADVDVQRSGGGFAAMEADFRQHCSTAHPGRGSYDECSPAYRYGYERAQAGGGDWAASESEMRRGWEADHPGTWERFKDSIRYAWDRARGARTRAA